MAKAYKILTRISSAPGEMAIQLNGLSLSALVASPATEAGPTFSQPVPLDVAEAIMGDPGLAVHFTVTDEPAPAKVTTGTKKPAAGAVGDGGTQ